MRRHVLGIIAVLVGVVALGLATLPGIIWDQPLPWGRPRAAAREEPGLTVRIKGLAVNFGKAGGERGR